MKCHGCTQGRDPGVCLKGRALWGQTQSSYKAVGAHCKIGCGGSHWRLGTRVGGVLGLRTCLRVELKEERWGGGGGHPPCGDTWLCQVMIAIKEIAKAPTCTAKEKRSPPPFKQSPAGTPRVTFRRVVVPLRGPRQSPVLPFARCVGSLRSVGRCGRCSCWCRFRVRGAPSLVCRGPHLPTYAYLCIGYSTHFAATKPLPAPVTSGGPTRRFRGRARLPGSRRRPRAASARPRRPTAPRAPPTPPLQPRRRTGHGRPDRRSTCGTPPPGPRSGGRPRGPGPGRAPA